MNVSSVKNLNGEVLSAVQDASLTNVIQANSGNWQDITAYQNASAMYLSEVSIPESATWNETSNVVQSNSAQWAGGSTTASDTVIFHKSSYQPANGGNVYTNSYVSNASDLYFESCVHSNFSAPNNIIIEQNGSLVGEAYWTQVSSEGEYNYYSASFKGQPNSDYKLNNNGYDSYYWCYVYAKGIRTEAFTQGQYHCSTNDTVKINVLGSNIAGTISGMNQGMATSLTSINYGILENFTAKGYEQYNCDISPEVYENDCSYSLSAEFEVDGGDVSALQRLMGIDETVLYNNLTGRPIDVGSYIDLYESPLNFTEIAIYLNGSTPTGSNNISNGYEKVPVEQLSSSNGLEFIKEFVGDVGNSATVHHMGCGYSGTSGTRWTKWYGYAYDVHNKNTTFTNNIHLNIWKVVGIGRKA